MSLTSIVVISALFLIVVSARLLSTRLSDLLFKRSQLLILNTVDIVFSTENTRIDELVFKEIIIRTLNSNHDISLQLFSFIKGTLYNSRRGTVIDRLEVLDIVDIDKEILSIGSYDIITTIITNKALTVSMNTITKDNKVIITLELISSIVENISKIKSRLYNIILNKSIVIDLLLCSVMSNNRLLFNYNDSVLDHLYYKVSDNWYIIKVVIRASILVIKLVVSLNEEVLEEFLALILKELIIKLVVNLDSLYKFLRS